MLSLGDQRSYFLGTAKNELGVVYAKHPISGVSCPGCQVAEAQLSPMAEEPHKKLLSAA